MCIESFVPIVNCIFVVCCLFHLLIVSLCKSIHWSRYFNLYSVCHFCFFSVVVSSFFSTKTEEKQIKPFKNSTNNFMLKMSQANFPFKLIKLFKMNGFCIVCCAFIGFLQLSDKRWSHIQLNSSLNRFAICKYTVQIAKMLSLLGNGRFGSSFFFVVRLKLKECILNEIGLT